MIDLPLLFYCVQIVVVASLAQGLQAESLLNHE